MGKQKVRVSSPVGVVLLLSAAAVFGERYEQCSTAECSRVSACATIYQHRGFGGWPQCIQMQNADSCVNLNQWWTSQGSRVSGVNPHGNCIRIYEGWNCRGLFLEVREPTGYLNNLQFEDETYSISPCGRYPNYHSPDDQYSPDTNCRVSTLFGPKVPEREVTSAANNARVDQLLSIGANGVAVLLPGANVFYEGLRFLVSFSRKEQSVSALIDAKVNTALLQYSVSQLDAHMHAVESRLQSALSSSTSPFNRASDLLVALHSCQMIASLFSDAKYSFRKNALMSSPYLVGFSSVYYSVAKLIVQSRPEMRRKVSTDMNLLADLNRQYQTAAAEGRNNMLYLKRFPMSSGMKKACDSMMPIDDCMWGNHRQCSARSDRCDICLRGMRAEIIDKMKAFFDPVVNSLQNFS